MTAVIKKKFIDFVNNLFILILLRYVHTISFLIFSFKLIKPTEKISSHGNHKNVLLILGINDRHLFQNTGLQHCRIGSKVI